MKIRLLSRFFLFLCVTTAAADSIAQDESGAVLATGTLDGTIDAVMQDDGYIIIDGNRLEFRQADVVITYNDQAVRASFLSPGQEIRYRTGDDGSISLITLIGPLSELNEIDNQ